MLKPLICCLMSITLCALTTLCTAAERIVSVNGKGLVQVSPDEVVIEMRATAVDDDLVRVRGNSDKQLQGILDLARKHGAKDGDFKVSELQLSLSHNAELKRPIYHVERELSVRLGELGNLNALLAELLKLSDTTVNSISFGSSKAAQHIAEASKLAVQNARKSAELLAAASDLKLGKPRQINDFQETQRPFVTSVVPVVGQNKGPSKRSPVMPPSFGGFMFISADVAVKQGETAKQAAPANDAAAFGLGKIEFSSSVAIEYELLE